MCGRFYLKIVNLELSAESWLADYDVLTDPGFTQKPRYNIGPMTEIPVFRPAPEAGALQLTALKWGLVPFWSDDPKFGARCINARGDDGIENKPAFRAAFKKRRCVVPASGFYEWRKMDEKGKVKQPYAIGLASGEPLFFAGLWERTTKTPEPLETVTICTTKPNSLMERVHDRMPVILTPESAALWLDPEVEDTAKLLACLAPYDASKMRAWPVDTYVGKVGNEGERCIEPIADPAGELAL